MSVLIIDSQFHYYIDYFMFILNDQHKINVSAIKLPKDGQLPFLMNQAPVKAIVYDPYSSIPFACPKLTAAFGLKYPDAKKIVFTHFEKTIAQRAFRPGRYQYISKDKTLLVTQTLSEQIEGSEESVSYRYIPRDPHSEVLNVVLDALGVK